jgi:hypothetical protein
MMILSFHLYEKKLIFILAVISILDTLFSMIDLFIIRNLFFLSIQLADDMTLQLQLERKCMKWASVVINIETRVHNIGQN